MFRRFALAFCALATTAACSGAPDDAEPVSTDSTSEELVSCGWLSGGSCTNLPPGDWRSPYFWADVYLAKYAAQRRQFNENIEPSPFAPLATRRPVLLVTGVTIRGAWFDGIAARLRRDGFDPVVYEPPDLLAGSLEQNTKDLGAVIQRVKKESGQDKIDILAECTGGVIARHYIQSYGGAKDVARMVTFVSPQHGIGVVPLVARIAGWPALYDLSPGSPFMHRVNDVPLPKDVQFTSIYTCNDEYITPYTTSMIPGARNVNLCGRGFGFVGHFRTMYDVGIYNIMHDELVRPLPGEN
jgi:triacylglycerol esterase/lipase EstA (alpha/beta hydrolase family)